MGRGAESLRQVVLVKGSMGKGPVSLRLVPGGSMGKGAGSQKKEGGGSGKAL